MIPHVLVNASPSKTSWLSVWNQCDVRTKTTLSTVRTGCLPMTAGRRHVLMQLLRPGPSAVQALTKRQYLIPSMRIELKSPCIRGPSVFGHNSFATFEIMTRVRLGFPSRAPLLFNVGIDEQFFYRANVCRVCNESSGSYFLHYILVRE